VVRSWGGGGGGGGKVRISEQLVAKAELVVKERLTRGSPPSHLPFGLYTILSLPIWCGLYINNGGSGGNIILRNSVGDDRGVGCLNKGWVCRE